VRKLLPQLGYSRQANRKANDGRHHADRDAQFEHINTQVRASQANDQAGDLDRHQEDQGSALDSAGPV
jgi:hypothetical protein